MNSKDSTLHCVKCAQPGLIKQGEKAYLCTLCGFVYFHNVAAYLWLDVTSAIVMELAFVSGQKALRAYLRRND